MPNKSLSTMTGARLAEIRREINMTQVELAEKIGCAKNHVSLMERGDRPVPVVTALAVEGLLLSYRTRLDLPAREGLKLL